MYKTLVFTILAYLFIGSYPLHALPGPTNPSRKTLESVAATSLPQSVLVKIDDNKPLLLQIFNNLAPAIAIIVAFIALLKSRMEARHTYASKILEYRLKQMREFYAPALAHIEESRKVYDKLIWTIQKEGLQIPLEGFRLLDHIQELKKLPTVKPIVDRIILIGRKLTRLISKNAGLIEGGITPTFIEYQAHFSILDAAYNQQLTDKQIEGAHEFGYYPRMLNREIKEGYKIILGHISNYTEAGDKIIAGLLGQKDERREEYRRRLIQNLQYYERGIKKYISRFDSFDLSKSRGNFLKALKDSHRSASMPRILDIGCGTGRDAIEFIKAGYAVTATDASPAMLRELRNKISIFRSGNPAEPIKAALDASLVAEKSFDELDYNSEFDGAWAAASLLHLPKMQIEPTIRRITRALVPGGVLFMSFRHGKGESEYDARFYCSYGKRNISSVFKKIPEAEIINIWFSDSVNNQVPSLKHIKTCLLEYFGKYDSEIWLNVLVKRKE